jgi:alpha-ketoglutarate-dependent taurine dioxygenase
MQEGSLVHRPKAWRRCELTKADVIHRFSATAAGEIPTLLGRDAPRAKACHLQREVEDLRDRVEDRQGFAIVEPPASLDRAQQRHLAWLIGRLLGEPVEQSGDGAKAIEVYDRDRMRRMADGARYHQTREGGSIHTDNVNRPETWDYLMMACVAPAMLGVETIVVSGLAVHEVLAARAPQALELLARDFWWECRGFSDDFFRAPVLCYDECGLPRFRYLRPYLESAHRRRGAPLAEQQLWALDALDAALELSELQFRCTLAPGEIIVIDDLRMFHGRTSFSDFLGNAGGPPRRRFDRLWISRRAA